MRRVALILFLLIAALPFLFFAVSGRNPAPRDHARAQTASPRNVETLTIISPHRREVRLEYSRGFSEWLEQTRNRRVEIQWLDVGGASKILKELESRFSTAPDAPGVDLLFGGGVAPFLTAVDHHWLAPASLSSDLLTGIPEMCAGSPVYDKDGYWFGVTLSGFGILFNKPLIQRLRLPQPETWEDLARPEYFSWVGSGDPRSSGSVHMCYEIILQSLGFEKGWPVIARICANVRTFGEAGGTVPREVAAGDIAAGMVIDQYAQTVIDATGGDSLAFSLPRQQTVISPDAIALIRGAPHPELAKLFIEYTLCPEGQRLLYQPAGKNGQASALHRMPVIKALYADADAPRPNPYDYPAGLKYNNALATQRWTLLNDLMGVWLIDAHADLKAAWKHIIDQGTPAQLVTELSRLPLSEKELAALAGKWNDPRLKHDQMQAWSLEARARYEALKK